ncbi:MAG: hypothetical protein KC646_13485 [Candidatus Cloacimonetes bacterium]|nr:hypothetical protein [Candidatus Cloacimonadota bacterium]
MESHLKVENLYTGNYSAGQFIAKQSLIIDTDNKSIIVSPGTNFAESRVQKIVSKYPVKAIIAPNSYHNMGVAIVQEQFDVPCYATNDALLRLSKLPIKSLTNISQLKVLREDLTIFIPKAQKMGELWISLGTNAYKTLIVTDAFFNLKNRGDNFFMSMISRLVDNAPGFKVSRLFSMLAVTDKKEYSKSVRNYFEVNQVDEMIVAHGEIQVGNIKNLVKQSLSERGL